MIDSLNGEIWRDIPNVNGAYMISNLGRVYSAKSNIIMKLQKSNRNYLRVNILYDKFRPVSVHRLVAEAFIPNPENKPCVNHIDNNPKNNRADNLEWCTVKENTWHAIEIGVRKNKGIHNIKCKLTEQQVLEIRDYYDIQKMKVHEISKLTKMSWSAIDNIVKRRHWKHL